MANPLPAVAFAIGLSAFLFNFAIHRIEEGKCMKSQRGNEGLWSETEESGIEEEESGGGGEKEKQ